MVHGPTPFLMSGTHRSRDMRFVLPVVLSLVIAGCGGGGGGSHSSPAIVPPAASPPPFPLPVVGGTQWQVGDSHYSTSGIPQRAADVHRSPVYSHGDILQAGVDQGRSVASLPSSVARGNVSTRYGELADGAGSSALSSYLSEGLGTAVRRYNTAPDVRVIGAASAADVEMVAATVRLVNAALPEGAKLRMGASLPGFSLRDTVSSAGRRFVSGREIDNAIHVEFIPAGRFHSDAGATTWNHFGEGVENSYIQFNMASNVYRDATVRRRTILLAHEIIHALGIFRHGHGHVSPAFDTIMEGTADIYDVSQGIQQPRSLLYPVDREALRALYGRLDTGDDPTAFGPWSSTSLHVVGNSPHAHFGVALRNGYAEPWAYGYRPDSALADNEALGGNATWTGALLGFTPQASAVAGDARIGIDLTTMTGRADFTSLESFPAGQPPGSIGTGTQWLDGDLGYTITTSGNTFRQTGGDAGRVTGVFVGRSHEGAAGTLERNDLTAAFGASR